MPKYYFNIKKHKPILIPFSSLRYKLNTKTFKTLRFITLSLTNKRKGFLLKIGI